GIKEGVVAPATRDAERAVALRRPEARPLHAIDIFIERSEQVIRERVIAEAMMGLGGILAAEEVPLGAILLVVDSRRIAPNAADRALLHRLVARSGRRRR